MNQTFALTTLVVADYDEAIAWYTQVLGFALREDAPQEDGKRWVVIGPPAGGALLLAQATTEAQRARIGDQTGGRVGFFLYTDDFDGDFATMQARGVRFAETPRVEDYGKVAVFFDLYGNRWDLLEMKR